MYTIDLFENPGTPEDQRPQAEYVPSGPHVPGSRNRALGNANLALIMKSLDTPGNPPITLSFLNGTNRHINSDEINDIADYYDSFKTKTERANFIYRTLVSQDKISNLLARLKQTELDFNQPEAEPETPEPEQLDLFKEDKKSFKDKDNELTGRTAKDITVARELQKLRARHPAAKTDIEALVKDEIVNQEKTDKTISSMKNVNLKQDELLKQISAINQAQQKEIDDLENDERSLQQTVQQLRQANASLAQKLSAMKQRRSADKEAQPQLGVSVATDKIAQPGVAPAVGVTPTTKLTPPAKKPAKIAKPEEVPAGMADIGGIQSPIYRSPLKKAEIPSGLAGGFRRSPRGAERRVHEVHDIGSGQVGAMIEGQPEEQSLQDVLFRTAAKAMYDAGQAGVSMDYEDAIRTASKLMGIPYAPSMLPALQHQLAGVKKQIATQKLVKKNKLAREKEKLTHQSTPDEERRAAEWMKQYGTRLKSRLNMRENEISVSGSPVKQEKGYYSIWIKRGDRWSPLTKYPDRKEAEEIKRGLEKRGEEVIIREGTMQQAREHPTGPKFTGYWKGTDKGTPGTKMVGSNESVEPNNQDVLGQLFKDFEKIFGKQSQQPKQPQQPVKEALRAGYNPLTSEKHWHEVKNHLTKLLANPDIGYEDKQVIRQRYLDKQKEAQQKGWEK